MSIKLEYGMREGRIVLISEIKPSEKGGKCNCTCPACGGFLVAKLGPIRQPHFAHKAAECDISQARETGLHKLAKEIIRESHSILVPGLIISESEITLGHINKLVADKVTKTMDLPNIKAIEVEYGSVELEKQIGDIRPDAVITFKDQPRIVEIAVTHPVDEDKENKLKKIGLYAFEIDLSALLKNPATREEITDAVLSDETNREWLFNPLREQKLKDARDEFQKKYNEEVWKQEQAKNQTVETEKKETRIEKKKQETEKRQQDTIENTFAKEIIGMDFSRQDIQIRDSSGVRWVQCKYCGKITPEYSFSSYGGDHGMNYGICKECYNKPEIIEQIERGLTKDI